MSRVAASIFFVAFCLAAVVRWLYVGRRWAEAVKEAASSLGLSYDGGAFYDSARASGVLSDGRQATIEKHTTGSGKNSKTYAQITVSTDLPTDLKLSRAGGGIFSKLIYPKDLDVGDATFDDSVQLGGRDAEVLARLDRETRQYLVGLIGQGLTLSNGNFVWRRIGLNHDAGRLTSITNTLRTIASRMEITDVAAALARNAREDGVAGVRLACLRMLLTHFRGHAASSGAIAHGMTDPDVCVRVVAASAAGADGFEVLAALAADPAADTALRSRALLSMREGTATQGRAVAVIHVALSDPNTAVVDAALSAASVLGVPVPSTRLAAISSTAGPAGAVAIARILRGGHGPMRPETEDLVLDLLAGMKSEDDAIVALCTTLSVRGTIRAVPALDEASRGLTTAARVKDAAREAVASIHSRAGHSEAGSLAVVDHSAGDLALSDHAVSASTAGTE